MENFKEWDGLYFYLQKYMQFIENRDSLSDSESPKEMEHLVYYDDLTELKNRRAFEKDANELSERGGYPFGILSIDANQLKMVNDAYGHQQGDVFLKEIADSMEEIFGKEHSYRFGGDEFAVILAGRDPKEIPDLIKAFKGSLQKKKVEENQISAAVGYAACPDGKYLEALKEADKRMYEDKKRYQGKRKQESERKELHDFSVTYALEGIILLYGLAVLAVLLLN